MSNDNKQVEQLDESTINRDPIRQFQSWFTDAVACGMPLPEAMTMASVGTDGKPHARVLLLKQVDAEGFVFFTNYRSAKAREMDYNPYVALCFHWPQLERQVRVEGKVERISAEESRDYFRTRPRDSQIGAWVSPQSEVISSRAVLEQRKAELEKYYSGRDIDCPEHWGGYRLLPERIEFWKGREGRLHDRLVFERTTAGSWVINRLAP
jgi:pyridoxamine 5'-phosphate oxidase